MSPLLADPLGMAAAGSTERGRFPAGVLVEAETEMAGICEAGARGDLLHHQIRVQQQILGPLDSLLFDERHRRHSGLLAEAMGEV